jgi:hypothetical protein
MSPIYVPGKVVLAQTYVEGDRNFSNVSLLLHGDGTNGSTTITDSSPSPKTVTAVGNAQISTAQSKFGDASIAFDGNNDYLDSSDASLALSTGNFTIELFVNRAGNPSTSTATSSLFDFRTSEPSVNAHAYIQGSSAGQALRFTYYVNGVDRIISSTQATTGVWRHLAIVRNNSVTTMYIDGVSEGTWADASNYTSSTLRVSGRFAAISGNFLSLNGYIDDLRITNGVARYTANFTPPTAAFADAQY